MSQRFTLLILLGMLLGLAAGVVLHASASTPAQAREIAGWFSLVTDTFLRLIKMIIAPLVLSTLVAGIAHMGDGAAIGRVGLKAILWFVVAGIVSLAIGMAMVEWLQPGRGLALAPPPPAPSPASRPRFR